MASGPDDHIPDGRTAPDDHIAEGRTRTPDGEFRTNRTDTDSDGVSPHAGITPPMEAPLRSDSDAAFQDASAEALEQEGEGEAVQAAGGETAVGYIRRKKYRSSRN